MKTNTYNHEAIAQELKKHQLTQGQIAEMFGCRIRTVWRIAQEYSLNIGQGISRFWEFQKSSPELCYLIGTYLTDAGIGKDYKTKKPRQFVLSSTTPEYIEYTFDCLDKCGLKPHRQTTRTKRKSLGNKPQYLVASYSSMFAQWIYSECDIKSSIPDFLFSATMLDKIAFFAGAIDGDGTISKDGSIRIRGIDHWLFEAPELLASIGIRSSGPVIDRVLKSGKPYYGLSIRRSDYVKQGGFCIIHSKQNRLMNAKSRKGIPCPICGEYMANPNSKSCRNCYYKSHHNAKNLA